MASYISSNSNRFYTALEGAYGEVGAITATNRIPAVKLGVKQQLAVTSRKDKTGSRTFSGIPPGGRRNTSFDLQTYFVSWDKTNTQQPGYSPLMQAAMGGLPKRFSGGTTGAGSHDSTLVLTSSQGLAAGQALTYAGEIRFIAAVLDATTVQLTTPFSSPPAAGAPLGSTLTHSVATDLPSVSIFDYWSPSTAVQRILCGAAVNRLEVRVNGDYHDLRFSGVAQELIDTTSFSGQIGQLQAFPAEPAVAALEYLLIPGNMGQIWLGSSPRQFYTLTGANIVLDNSLDLRNREFGSSLARAISPGQRKVTAAFEIYGLDDDATSGLYQAAKQQSPIELMLQLGDVEGQLMGVYLKSVIPEVPEFDDSTNQLQWKFRDSRAQGSADDELFVAFA